MSVRTVEYRFLLRIPLTSTNLCNERATRKIRRRQCKAVDCSGFGSSRFFSYSYLCECLGSFSLLWEGPQRDTVSEKLRILRLILIATLNDSPPPSR